MNSPMIISKSKYVAGVQCLKRLYLLVHQPELAAQPDESDESISSGIVLTFGRVSSWKPLGGLGMSHSLSDDERSNSAEPHHAWRDFTRSLGVAPVNYRNYTKEEGQDLEKGQYVGVVPKFCRIAPPFFVTKGTRSGNACPSHKRLRGITRLRVPPQSALVNRGRQASAHKPLGIQITGTE